MNTTDSEIDFITSVPVYINAEDTTGNPYRLTPYINTKGDIWLYAEGNGCGNDIMVEDLEGKTDWEIVREYDRIDIAAMRKAAEQMRTEGYADESFWLTDWCDTVEKVMSRVRYATIDERRDGTGDQYTEDFKSREEAVNAAERAWGYLTDMEKSKRHICAVLGFADEDGEFDWGSYDIVKEFRS